MDLVTTLLTATTTSAGATYVVTRARRRRRRKIALRRRIDACAVDLPLDTRHLSPRLAALAVGARTTRLVLETPLMRFDERILRETPWGLRERLSEYDVALADARLALWHWLRTVASLDVGEFQVLRQLGLDPRPLRSIMYKPGVFDRTPDVFDESIYPVVPDLELVGRELCAAMDDLRRFELALLSHRPDPYR